MKIFIFGFGQVSKELAKKLSNEKIYIILKLYLEILKIF